MASKNGLGFLLPRFLLSFQFLTYFLNFNVSTLLQLLKMKGKVEKNHIFIAVYFLSFFKNNKNSFFFVLIPISFHADFNYNSLILIIELTN